MNVKKKEDLIEQYEDAAFALMMSNYAEEEGNRLLQEFEEAKSRGTVPPVPEELDKKCRMRIRRAYQKARTRARIRRSVRVIGKSAAVLLIAIGLCTTLIVSVDALRIPVFNFFFEQYEEFTSVNFGKDPTSSSMQPTADAPESESGETPLGGLLPEGYAVALFRNQDDGTYVALYRNSLGDDILLSATLGHGAINVDSEHATVEPVLVGQYPGYLFSEGCSFTIVWYNEQVNTSYLLKTANLEYATFWRIVEQFAQRTEENK